MSLAKEDYVLYEFSLTYLACFTRVQLMLLPDVSMRLEESYIE